jgi:hypothetical protein
MAFTMLEGMPEDHAEWLWSRGGVRASELLVEHTDKVIRLAARILDVHEVDAAGFLHLMRA